MTQLGWMEKWTLRFAVIALVFLAMAGFEGVLMRTELFSPPTFEAIESVVKNVRPGGGEHTTAELFYGMLTAHPIVGIYGFVYMAIMGAFYYLVPHLLGKEIRYKKLVPLNFALQIIGVMTSWLACFFGTFNSLYTLYWPLPVSYDRVPLVASIFFIAGLAVIMVNVLIFSFNLFSTVLRRSNLRSYSFWQFLRAAFGISRLMKWLGKEDKNAPNLDYDGLPVFIVAVGRGSIDTVLNAIVILTAGVLILVYALAALFKAPLDPTVVDALIYKNWFWWGLDMVADGNVLMYTSGIWYLLIPLLTGRKLFGESVVKTVIMVDLLVSMGVWSHHLLGEQTQPLFMRILSGQFITWGEFFTMGLTIFASLMTIWLARPVKLTPPLKFILGSIFGFIIGGATGLIQANVGLNIVMHNTQWVPGPHFHVLLLIGVGMLIAGVIYALVPMLTKIEIKTSWLVNLHFWAWLGGGVIMAYGMGMAGSKGMLRRTLYETTQYQPYMAVAMVGGILLAIGFLAFLTNVVATLGLINVISLFVPEKWLKSRLDPAGA